MTGWLKTAPVLIALGLCIFPLLFLLLYDAVSLTGIVLLFAVLVLGRVLMLRQVPAPLRAAVAGAAVLFAFAVTYSQSGTLLKLYPVAVNAALLGWGLYTLRHPPSAIERVVLKLGWPVSAPGQRYMRGVTGVWCLFFAANGIAAAVTAAWLPTSVWAWYNGAASYLLAAALFGVELVVRHFYRRHHAGSEA